MGRWNSSDALGYPSREALDILGLSLTVILPSLKGGPSFLLILYYGLTLVWLCGILRWDLGDVMSCGSGGGGTVDRG